MSSVGAQGESERVGYTSADRTVGRDLLGLVVGWATGLDDTAVTPEKLPNAAYIAAIQEAQRIVGLLDRGDLPATNVAWWYSIISVCNTGLLSAEVGAVDADEWGKALVCALDKARDLGVLGEEEVIHRRMIACAASLRYFGVCEGDQSRDPEMIVRHFLATHRDRSPQDLVRKCAEIVTISREVHIDASFYRRIKYVRSIRMELQALSDVLGYLGPGPLREEAAKWSNIAASIPLSRLY